MPSSDPAFGQMLHQLVDLGVIIINTEPLDAAIERRLKLFWESTTCPRCGNTSIYTWESSDRVCCRNCPFKPVYTYTRSCVQNDLLCDSRGGSHGEPRLPPRLEPVSAHDLWANTDRRIWEGLFRVQRPRSAARQPSSRRVVPDRQVTVERSSRRSTDARRGLPRLAPSDSWEAWNRL